MAALRVYLALALESDFNTRSASISWNDLENLTGLSRPSISKGIRRAAEAGLLDIDSSAHRHRYTLVGSAAVSGGIVPFARIPRAWLKAALPKLPTRGKQALNCLKIYITLVTVLPRHTTAIAISHKKLVEWTGVQTRDVRAAIDVLINHRLLHLGKSESMSAAGHPFNEYFLLGLSPSDVDGNDAEGDVQTGSGATVPSSQASSGSVELS